MGIAKRGTEKVLVGTRLLSIVSNFTQPQTLAYQISAELGAVTRSDRKSYNNAQQSDPGNIKR